MLVTYFFAVLGFLSLTFASAIPRDEATTPDTPSGQACKEGELKCLAASDDGKDGGVFRCTDGMWAMFQDCRSYERCVTSPTPHCTWAKQLEVDVSSG
jgi:hypothetical protein